MRRSHTISCEAANPADRNRLQQHFHQLTAVPAASFVEDRRWTDGEKGLSCTRSVHRETGSRELKFPRAKLIYLRMDGFEFHFVVRCFHLRDSRRQMYPASPESGHLTSTS